METKTGWRLAQVAFRFGCAIVLGAIARLLLTAAGLQASTWYALATIFNLLAMTLTWSHLLLLPRPVAVGSAAGLVVLTLAVLGPRWTSRDYFLSDFNRVHPGMPSAEADALMAAYVGGPLFNANRSTTCRVFHHSFEPAWNADLGTICYRDGAVISVQFSPD